MTRVSTDTLRSYAFGRYRLAVDGSLLVCDSVRVALAPKVLQTLLVLVERAGRVVSKADLLAGVWPDSFVEETGLTRNVSLLRQALGDTEQKIIATVARIGYRFTAPVTMVAASGADDRETAAASPPITRLMILPFTQLGNDPDIGFLAFSVPDAVIHALSGLSSLVVRSSRAAARFAESFDLAAIAATANVDVVLTGTLLRSEEQLRVTAQLVTVPDGTVKWSGSFELALASIFELQDQLVARIISALPVSLTSQEQRRLKNDVPASPSTYEFYLRGIEAVGPQGILSASRLRTARELYARAIDEDPKFAPAWVQLGRCHYLLGKTSASPEVSFQQAESCFAKALALSPDLPLGQNLYALLEIDRGLARHAMLRLLARGLAGSAQPELYAALVQACRFCGLLEPAIAAHRRARQLDPAIPTGGYLAFWQSGDEESALREEVNPCWLVDALIVGMRGDVARALALLDAERGATGVARNLAASLAAVFQRRRTDALESTRPIFDAFPDPEMVYFAARSLSFFAEPRALDELTRSLERGFVLYRVLLRRDPWLDPLRSVPAFHRLVERSREAYRQCRQAYIDAGGERLLGPAPAVDALEASQARSALRAAHVPRITPRRQAERSGSSGRRSRDRTSP